MNCKQAHLTIAGLTGDETPPALAAHVERCPACAALLGADARLRATLRSPAPVASPAVLARLREGIAASPRRRTPIEAFLRNPTMKITLPATALLAVALVATLPRAAEAATPRATFAKMRKAVLAHAKSMTSLDVKVGKTPDGAVGTWVVLDGELTQLGPNGTFHSVKDGKDITVQTSMNGSPDLSSLTPAQRAQVQKAIRDAMSGHGLSNSTVRYIVDGKPVDAATGQAKLHEQGIDLTLSIDLDESDYRSILFGADHDHLVLLPKNAKDRRTVVTLDPKTSLPRAVAEERQVGGAWRTARTKAVRLG